MASLDGKVAAITGASSGIGEATAIALADAGAKVSLGARRKDRLDALVEKIGDKALAIETDIGEEEQARAFVQTTKDELGGLDILINNAGLGLGRDPFDASSEEDEETVLETNVHGLMRMTRLCLAHLRDGGHIVNMGSIAGRQAYENAAVYVASKFAVRGFSYALREDLLGRPIHVTTVDPGLVESNFSRVRFRGDEEKAGAVYADVEPLTPDDVADCVVFAVTRPNRVNIDELVVKALAQSSPVRIVRAT
jgi:3-hydroxy acid dehydrogenase / malonic semialdehyde reductase